MRAARTYWPVPASRVLASRVLALLVLVSLVLASPIAATSEAPRLEREGDYLRLVELPDVLAEERVASELDSGLTTTFLLRLLVREPGARKRRGGARVEVRYEPWDEVYHVVVLGFDGRGRRRTVASLDELRVWWRQLRPAVLLAPGGMWARASARVELEVVPFSRDEARDARRWLSDALERSASGGEEIERVAPEPDGSLGQLFHLLLATSIESRALVSYRWDLVVPAAEDAR